MDSERLNLTRRKFMIVGSAAIAAPLIMDLAGSAPKAKAATAKATTATGTQKTYYIGHKCIGCQVCRLKCPASAINFGDDRNEIDQKKCKHCGTCFKNCPISVISEI